MKTDKYAVFCVNSFLKRMFLQALAERFGCAFSAKGVVGKRVWVHNNVDYYMKDGFEKYLYITFPNDNEPWCFTHSPGPYDSGYTVLRLDKAEDCKTIEQILKDLEAPIVMVGEYLVSNVNKDGFSVGCQSVTWEEYDIIGKLRPK